MPRQAPKPRRNKLLPLYVIMGAGILAFLIWIVPRTMQGGGGAAATELQPVVMTPEQLQRVPGISKGQANAPVVVMEFADFQCPACGDFSRFSEPLIKDYIDNGTVRFVWYDFPLIEIHPNAMLASRAGRCANDQNQFWPFHDYVFGQQGQWAEEKNPVNRFIGYAEQMGMDRTAFTQCLRSDKYQKEVSESRQLGTTLGVSGTPTVFVNGRKLEGYPRSRADWDEAIRNAGGFPGQAPGAAPAAAPAATDSAAPADSTPGAAAPADSAAG